MTVKDVRWQPGQDAVSGEEFDGRPALNQSLTGNLAVTNFRQESLRLSHQLLAPLVVLVVLA